MKALLLKYPRLLFLIIGFLMGMIPVGISNQWSKSTISEYKEIASKRESKYEELLERSRIEIEALAKVNESLKQTIRSKKVTKPDGTVTEEVDTATDSTKVTETEIRTTVEHEYEKKLATERAEHVEKLNKLTNRKLRLGVGYTTSGEYYGHGSYNLWGPVSIGGGATSSGTFLIDIGITL